MFRLLLQAVGWLVSVILRVAFVLAVVGFAAGFALGGLPADTGMGEALGDLGLPADIGDIEALGDVGSIGEVSLQNDSDTGDAPNVSASSTAELNGTRLEYLVHRYINAERAERGKSNLTFDTDLRAVARYHSADMAERNYFSHVGPDGETLADRYRRFDYRCRVKTGTFQYATGGENILYTYYDAPVAMGNHTVEYDSPKELARGIVNGWMNSTSHRKNLLKPYWEREGIGIHIERTNGRTRVYATQNFC
jgi:uncharacterized protein YkwD